MSGTPPGHKQVVIQVPMDVWRQSKARAIFRDMSLSEWIADYMRQKFKEEGWIELDGGEEP